MDQTKKLWGSLSSAQKMSILLAIAMGVGLYYLVVLRREANFRPLYQGLTAEDAAQVTQRLKDGAIEYRLADQGGTILVSTDRLDEARLALARDGLPKTGRLGFELFDRTNFGTTDFAEHINYRRALEGELERTIGSIGEVERARVHITMPKDSLFVEQQQPAKASVLLTLRTRSNVSATNVAAISNLVASAVEGLSPDQVAVVNATGKLLSKPRSGGPSDAVPSTQLEYRTALETNLTNKLAQTLDAVLGAGNYRTGVSVECDFSGVDESEETLDPTKSVMTSSTHSEEVVTNAGSGGVPGTASNLPDPPDKTAAGSGASTRKNDTSNYQTSRKVRHVQQARGTIQRITVAVLLDQEVKWEKNGETTTKVLVPPAPEKINVIKGIVANVAGINMERGDQLTVESLPFDTTLRQEAPGADAAQPADPNATPAEQAKRILGLDPKILGGAAGGAVLLIVGLIFFLRSRGKKKVSAAVEQASRLEGAASASAMTALPAGIGGSTALPSEQELMEALNAPMSANPRAEALTAFLRKTVQENPQAATQLLRNWLLEDAS